MNNTVKKQNLLIQDRIAQVTLELYERRKFAYIRVDHSWRLQEVSDNLSEFGFEPMQLSSDVTDEIDFLIGIDTRTNLDLPMISTPTGIPIRATLMPSDNSLTVVIMDASEEFNQQKQLQQKANENQLLLDTQNKLMIEIEQAKQQLQNQNMQLQEAARLQSSFLSGVSHEFRTPLTSIIGYTNLLLDHTDNLNEKSATNYLAAVKRSSKHLLSLIENLLDHGKFDSSEIVLNPKATDLEEVFHDVALLVQPLAATKQISFELKSNLIDGSIALVDDSRLRQCLINIIGNAIKFTDVGGVLVSVNWLNDMLEIVVKDTGIGIRGEHLTKIKQPFWQAPDTGKSGTGLGLTITERIIEMMGGSLKISSQLNHGSTVTFDILAPRLESSLASQSITAQVLSKPLNILLAEDDEDIANLVVLLLEQQGVQVCHVENGALVIDQLKHHRFDLVLMDLHMPVLDGYAAVESIRDSGNQIPIVIMTASAIEADRGRAQALGCDGYLVKPVDVVDLLSLANQLLN